MILEDKEVEERINSSENLINRLENRVVRALPGRVVDNPGRVGDEIRKLIGIAANAGDATGNEVAGIFGVSSGLVSQTARGLNSLGALDPSLAVDNKKVDDAHSDALDLMVSCITNLKSKIDKVEKPEKLSKIAVDMSKIMSNLKGKDTPDERTRVNVILYRPDLRSEKEYETIEA